MFKYAKITLLTLAAFLVLGFSITTNAEPPWLADKDQVIRSAPLYGEYSNCMVTNTTDRVIEVVFSFLDDGGTNLQLPAVSAIPEGYPIMRDYEILPNTKIHICKVSWLGQPGDIRASYCRYSDALFTYDAACVELH